MIQSVTVDLLSKLKHEDDRAISAYLGPSILLLGSDVLQHYFYQSTVPPAEAKPLPT